MLTCSASQRSALIVTTSLRSYYQNQSPGFSNICYSAKKIKKDRCFSSNLSSRPFRTGFYMSHTHHGATLLKYHRCTTTGRYFKNRYPVCRHILKVLPPVLYILFQSFLVKHSQQASINSYNTFLRHCAYLSRQRRSCDTQIVSHLFSVHHQRSVSFAPYRRQ